MCQETAEKIFNKREAFQTSCERKRTDNTALVKNGCNSETNQRSANYDSDTVISSDDDK